MGQLVTSAKTFWYVFLVCISKSLWFVSGLPLTLSFFWFPHWNGIVYINNFKSMFSCIFCLFPLIIALCIFTKAYILRKRYMKMGELSSSLKEKTLPADWTLEILIVKEFVGYSCVVQLPMYKQKIRRVCIFKVNTVLFG